MKRSDGNNKTWVVLPCVYVVITICVKVLNQFLFKYLAVSTAEESIFTIFSDSLFLIICALLAVMAWSWQMALSHYPLSYIYPFTSIALVSYLVTGALFFNESVSVQNLVGTLIIILGVVVISSEKEEEAQKK